VCYYNIIKGKQKQLRQRKEVIKMAKRNTAGTYVFANGTTVWVKGMSALERKNYIRRYGEIVRFIPD
jgi:hypothetical protein